MTVAVVAFPGVPPSRMRLDRAPDRAAVEEADRDHVEEVEQEADVAERLEQAASPAARRSPSTSAAPTLPQNGPAIEIQKLCQGLIRASRIAT